MRPWARRSTPSTGRRSMFSCQPLAHARGSVTGVLNRDREGADCVLRDLGRIRYSDALELQTDLVARRKRGEIPDQLLIAEHPHVVTQGRNGHDEHLLAGPEVLARAGVEFHRANRGGDVTYHGPGQIVGYPILD